MANSDLIEKVMAKVIEISITFVIVSAYGLTKLIVSVKKYMVGLVIANIAS